MRQSLTGMAWKLFVTTEMPCVVTRVCGDTSVTLPDRAAPQLTVPALAPSSSSVRRVCRPLALCDADFSVRRLSCGGGGTSAGQSTIQQLLDLLDVWSAHGLLSAGASG